MTDFNFNFEELDHHIEKIGVDVRPQIDIKADALHIQDFYRAVSEKFPQLFEILVHSPTEFQIKKTLVVPGKAKLEMPTFILTPRGPVFQFPRKLAMFDHEFSWADDEDGGINAIVIECLEIFYEHVRLRNRLRIGKVREMIFSTNNIDSNTLIRERFAQGIPDNAKSILIGWLSQTENDQYNCKIQLLAVQKQNIPQPGIWGSEEQIRQRKFGVQVNLDVNNRDMSRPLNPDDMKIILDHSDSVFKGELLNILNRSTSK